MESRMTKSLKQIKEGLDYLDSRTELITIRKSEVVTGDFEILLNYSDFFTQFKQNELRKLETIDGWEIFTVDTPIRCVCMLYGEVDKTDMQEQYNIDIKDIEEVCNEN